MKALRNTDILLEDAINFSPTTAEFPHARSAQDDRGVHVRMGHLEFTALMESRINANCKRSATEPCAKHSFCNLRCDDDEMLRVNDTLNATRNFLLGCNRKTNARFVCPIDESCRL